MRVISREALGDIMAYIDENPLLKKTFHKQKNLHYYLAGFVDGEGCFTISLKQEPTTRFGWAIDPEFKVVQKKDKAFVLKYLQHSLNCGKIQEKPGQPNLMEFVVKNRRQISEKVIPFFKRYQLLVKNDIFQQFAKIVELLNAKKHFTKDGFKEILIEVFKIEQGKRKYSLDFILKNLKAPQRPYVGHTSRKQ
jgi:hypothetical protein